MRDARSVLVTGAAGKTGVEVTAALSRAGWRVRCLVRRREQEPVVQARGAAEVVVGDLRDASVVAGACAGAAAVYHICPNMSPDEVAIAEGLLAAAEASGVDHVVYHSVLHPQVEEMPHHWRKLQVEGRLVRSRVPWTVLQPAPYFQNVQTYWEEIRREGRYAVPYRVDAPLAMVDLADVGRAAAVVVGEPAHRFAVYELCGAAGVTASEVARVCAAALGRPVAAEETPRAAWQVRQRAAGMPEGVARDLVAMFAYYGAHGMAGSPSVLGWLLGRPPAGLAAFVESLAGGESDR
jgi:uncharacterized protein YbjT (DUF2867 family)